MTTTTREQIVNAIRSLGVDAGDLMIVHPSFKSLGGVEGGPAAVANALVDSVSPGGSVFVPTFTYGADAYDPATSPSADGVITEAFRKLPNTIRSLHATHPVAGVGPDASAILEGHDRVHAFAPNSPLWRLWERNAWVLLIGVGHFANSAAHVAEEWLEMPYLDRRRRARVVRGDGTIEDVELRRPGCSDAWDPVIGPPMRELGAIRERKVRDAKLQLMRTRDVVEVTAELLRRDPRALLCSRSTCDACNLARAMIEAKAQATE
jgi:aminoglycoside 3-N-acetyltransferase